MGWLFGKKKISRVPFPEPRQMDEGSLRFPSGRNFEKVIEPDDFKLAAGVGEELPAPSEPNKEQEDFAAAKPASFSNLKTFSKSEQKIKMEPLPVYVKVEAYQRVLGELDGLKKDLNKIHEAHSHLQASEYNEETNFTKLRKAVRGAHDRLLQIDKVLFKTQGE